MKLGDLTLNILLETLGADGKLKTLQKELGATDAQMQKVKTTSVAMSDGIAQSGLRFQGFMAIISLLNGSLGTSINKLNEYQNALLGLNSIAVFKGIDPAVATQTVQSLDLVKNGLLGVGDASTSLKNLLSANFTLEQSVELLNRLGDAAAFGRQGSLSFGEAVRSATEGIKNGNSILVDNAGVTKNLSVLLQEAGYSAQDLMNASSDAGVRMAIFNGILRETDGQLGNSNKLMQSSQGSALKFAKAVNDIQIEFGRLLSATTPLLMPLTSILQQLNKAPDNVKASAAAITLLAIAFVTLNDNIPTSVKVMTTIVALTTALPTPMRALAGAVLIVVGAVWAYNAAMTTAAATTTAATGGLNIALAVLAAGLASIGTSFLDFGSNTDQLKSSMQNTSTAVADFNRNIDKAIVVKELNQRQTALSTAEEKNYQDAIKDLANQFPAIVSGIDDKTGALKLNATALDDVIAKNRELAGIELSMKLKENTESISKSADEFFKLTDNLEKNRKESEIYGQIIEDNKNILDTLNATTESGLELLGNSSVIIAENNSKLEESNNIITVNEDKSMSLLNTVSQLVAEYISFGKIDVLMANLASTTGSNSNAVNMLKVAMGNLKAEGFAAINGINVGLLQHTNAFSTFATAWNEFSAAVSSGNIVAVKAVYDKMMSALTDLKVENAKIDKKTEEIKKNPVKTRGSSRSNIKEEKDAIEEQIKLWKELIDTYYFVDKAKGKNEESIVGEVTNYLKVNSLLDEQIKKLNKFKEDLEKDLSNKPVTLPITLGPDFKKQIEADVKVMYDEWAKFALKEDGVLKKNFKPFNEIEAFKTALELRKKQLGEELTINDLAGINLSIQQKINEIIETKAVNGNLDVINLEKVIDLQNDILKNEAQINQIREARISFDVESSKIRMSLIDDEFVRRRREIELEYALQRAELDKLRKENPNILPGQIAERQDIIALNRKKQLFDLQRQESQKLQSDIEGIVSAASNISSSLNIGANTFVGKLLSGLQQGLELARNIQQILEITGIFKSIIGFATGGASMALPGLGSLSAGMPSGLPTGFNSVSSFFKSEPIMNNSGKLSVEVGIKEFVVRGDKLVAVTESALNYRNRKRSV